MSDLKKKFEEGLDFLGNLNLSEAKACFEEITQNDVKNGSAWMFLGDIYLLESDFENSKAAHEKASKIDSDYGYPKINVETRSDFAKWEIKLNKKHDATIMYNDKMGIFFDYGETKGPLTLGEKREEVVFRPNVKMKLSRTESLIGLASPMYPIAGGMLAANAVSFEKFIKEDIDRRAPNLRQGGFMKKGNADEWANQGIALEILDKIEDAAKAYAGALKIDPKNYVAQRGLVKCVNRSRTGWKIKSFVTHPIAQGTIQQYGQLANNPIFAKARHGNDVVLSRNDILCLATRAFAHLDYMESSTFDQLSEKADAYSDVDDYSMSLELLDRALSIQPENTDILERVTGLYFNMQNFNKTAEYASQLVKLDHGNANAWAYLGMSQAFQGKPNEAEVNLRKAIELDSNHDLALLNLTSLLIQVKKCDDARAMLDIVKKKYPQEVWGVLQQMLSANCR